ncbi:Orotate phosphoribosyltransferase [Candidatus Nitrospira nitrosa]|uniref:Orotate phosphoribosyltransferase n=1 Tax=Candidatus Nitrospira nitrosa TaxID=1742972 RepID=A0A0S4L940_9BACT|nr:orotate phosphoribosyltransferase [Candidatus Nitrospira nitrosa]CUS33117.1 Orotate phosphoribosyltransferase [Candidatus Nitrospira nitrosa]
MTLREQLAKAFHDTGSFKWDRTNGFKLASGEISPFYVDCRALMAHPEARRLVAQLAYDALVQVEFDCLGGLEIGAIPIAVTISDFACAASPPKIWRTFVVRKQAKDHGLGKLIEGSTHPGDRVLIVDDVLTSGGSLLKAVGAAREAGLQVDHALVIVDRQEQDGKARVEKERVQLRSLLTIQDLIHVTKKSS